LAGIEPAGEVTQQVKRLGQARARAGTGSSSGTSSEERISRKVRMPGVCAAPLSPGGASTASRGVEQQHRARPASYSIDAVDGVLRRLRRARHHGQ